MQDCSVGKAFRKSDRDSNLLLNIRTRFYMYKYSSFLHKKTNILENILNISVIKV